jgi:sodium/pantothenate symporter
MDGIIPAYVVAEFPVYVSILVIMGLLSAGLSTLEGLIQSLSTTITNDIIAPLSKMKKEEDRDARRLVFINKIVIVALAIAAVLLTNYQLQHPNLSVGIFAQNGVYAFFSAAFMPVLLGVFTKNTPRLAPIAAAVTAVIVHFSVYYIGITPYMQGAVRNPAIAATLAILSSVLVGTTLYFLLKKPASAHSHNH